jgi:tyrosyl-tRNA synthetase
MIASNLVEDLQWRGMIHDMMPGTAEQLLKEVTTAYVGIDPTADSLHVGHLVSVMMLKHLQLAGHKPIALVGGATGMIGDPSFKSAERVLLDEETIEQNIQGIKKQLQKFLKFEGENAALILNNYDWFKNYSFIDFVRDAGKHITVNYMMSKDSVKKRLETGISFTEFTYQLLQGWDFYHLNKEYNCKLQMGGSDQWGNIVTGTELIRRKGGGDAYALTTPLITKADGTKFGKSEGGNIWLDPEKTSPYKFYQFWLNVSDEDAEKYIKIFTIKPTQEISEIIEKHKEAPHLRLLQSALAEDITVMVHSEEALQAAKEASEILFGKSTEEALHKLSENDFLAVFEGVPQSQMSKDKINPSMDIVEFLADNQVYPSKAEVKRNLQANAVAINKNKVGLDTLIDASKLIKDKYILVQKGKKNYHLVVFN